MSFWNLFAKKKQEIVPATVEDIASPVVERSEFIDDSDPESAQFATAPSNPVKTGMPIDNIYAFIMRNYDKLGFDDAMVDCSKEYRESREGIIRNELKTLFRQVRLAYNGLIRNLNVQIENAENQFVFSASKAMKAKKETCEEHLAVLSEMEAELDANDPKMTAMIQSYRRGFSKGIVAKSVELINL